MTSQTIQFRRLPLSITATLNLLLVVCGTATAAGPGAPIPASPGFTSPDIKPTFADWLTAHPIALAKKLARTDPLLKPPFAAAPVDSLKGMAAGIRAVQLDVPNRVKAVRYLGTVDCVTYPQAQDMLIATMLEDPSEEVRYEAVMALRNMLARGCCNMDTACECDSCGNRKKIVRQTENYAKKGQKALIKEAKGPAKKIARKVSREAETERYDCCRGCANEKAMKALAKVAYEKDDQCCWFEPSERVRDAAAEGMCLFKTYSDGYSLPDLGIAPTPNSDEEKQGEVDPSNEMESEPDSTPGTNLDIDVPVPVVKAKVDPSTVVAKQNAIALRVVQMPAVAPRTVSALPALKNRPEALQMPLISGLKGRCIVALKSRQVLLADPRFASVYEERTYYFSSAEAKADFDQNPKSYAPAYGGLDPVTWLAKRQMEEGQFLREYNGQFFLFASKENWETFKGNPNRYVLRSGETNLRTVAGTN